MNELTLVGRAEKVQLPTIQAKNVPAKIDTGADASSLWCSKAEFVNGLLDVTFFDSESPFYTGTVHQFKKNEFTVTRVSNSFGQKELRFKVKIPMKLKGRTIKATFTLADRSQKLYPILIGRSTLRGKFLVDVSRGNPLRAEEKQRAEKMQRELVQLKKEIKS